MVKATVSADIFSVDVNRDFVAALKLQLPRVTQAGLHTGRRRVGRYRGGRSHATAGRPGQV